MNIAQPYKYVIHHKLLICTIFIILCSHYYYLYFISFNEGSTHTPKIFHLLKIIASISFYIIFFDFKSITPKISSLTIATTLAIFVLISKLFILPVNDYIFLNFFALSLPYLILHPHVREESVKLFFPFLIFILCIQIIIDCYITSRGFSIWENKAFIGGFGNPSTLGIVCSISIAYILSRNNHFFFTIPYIVIVYGICQTKSLSTLGILLFIHVLYFFSQKKRQDYLYAILLACISLLIASRNLEGHLLYKFDSLIRTISNIFGEKKILSNTAEFYLNSENFSISTSIGNRLVMYTHLFDELFESPIQTLTIGFRDIFYNAADSQLVTFSGSFGIILAFIILYNLIFPFFNGTLCNSRFFSKSIGIIFTTYCLTNRILEYYPVCFIFIFLVGLLYDTDGNKIFHNIKSNQIKNQTI